MLHVNCHNLIDELELTQILLIASINLMVTIHFSRVLV